jgi:hypothetical protein
MPHNRQQESPIATPAQWGKHPMAGGVAMILALAVAILAGGCKSGGGKPTGNATNEWGIIPWEAAK